MLELKQVEGEKSPGLWVFGSEGLITSNESELSRRIKHNLIIKLITLVCLFARLIK
jgi:hypothetical protein